MKKVLLLLLLNLLSHTNLFAQVSTQLLVGNRSADYQFFWNKDLDKKKKLSLFNFTYYSLDYKNRQNSVYSIYQVGTYHINTNVGISAGGILAGGQFAPRISFSYQIQRHDLFLNVLPALSYLPDIDKAGYSVFILLFYTPKISENWKLYNQFLWEPLFANEGHVFSYQQFRVGLNYKDWFQFGIGANLSQVGKEFNNTTNLGIFINKGF
jgi:hypothetical protein